MIKVGRTATELVIANVLTKPLQGEQFGKETVWTHGEVKDKSVVVEYMPTELTIANVLTKPLQGEQFRAETAMITGNPVATDDEGDMEENERIWSAGDHHTLISTSMH